MSSTKSYIIVGAGNFGVSTALELIEKYPAASITLVDHGSLPNPRAASHDINKIVRADYADPMYMHIMLEAMEIWAKSDLYSPFYHQTGMIRADDTGFNEGCLQSFKALGHEVQGGYLSIEEVKTRWGGVLKHANFEGIERCYYNPLAGWGDAVGALNAATQSALDHGVKYRPDGVQKLIIDESGKCTGVLLLNGDQLQADSILLCAGARTALLLAESAPENLDIQAGKKLIATGAVCCATKLDPRVWDRYSGGPVVKNGLSHTHGECNPLTPDGFLKTNFEMSFTNLQWHEPSKQHLSMPLGVVSESSWSVSSVPQVLKESAQRVMRHTYGQNIEGIESETWRICWDVSTPSHNFIISPHSYCENLFLATGGSFHGWKFLPIIGRYIVKMLEGRLDGHLAKRWAWDEAEKLSQGTEKANHTYGIKADLKDIEGWGETNLCRDSRASDGEA